MGYLYLLHLTRPLAGSRSRHYTGWSEHAPEKRIAHHASGTGSAFMAEAKRQGIAFEVAGTWEGLTRTDERRLKNHKNAPRYCAICRPGNARTVMPSMRARPVGNPVMMDDDTDLPW